MPRLLKLILAPIPSEFERQGILSGFEVIRVSTLGEARQKIESESLDCVLVAGQTEELSSVELLEGLQGCNPTLPVIFWSDDMLATDAVRLIRAGAAHCVGYRDSLESLRESLWTAAEEKRRQDKERKQRANRAEPWRELLVGHSAAMDTVVETIRLIGPRRCTVLISGETGTGKEVAARALHLASPRGNQPFVPINCSALPENLLEAELFGHAKGAFTGAVASRIGRFEQAHRGTIFLDEIGDMPLDLQAKLLRVLQEREIQRLGSSETIRVDVRVIAASNVDLRERIQQGRFRQDLYYRLNVVPLQMPPLRQRANDIPLLVEHFVKRVCQAEGMPAKSVTPEALNRLRAGQWPGNVRQLENAVEMAVAMSGVRDVLNPADFGLAPPMPANVIPFEFPGDAELGEPMDFNAAVAKFTRTMLERALAKTTGNKTAAAELLGMKRTTLIMKLRSLESERETCAI